MSFRSGSSGKNPTFKRPSSQRLTKSSKDAKEDSLLRVAPGTEEADFLRYGRVKETSIYEGVCQKLSDSVGKWKAVRWFVLTPRRLIYYKTSENGPPGDQDIPMGILDISDIEHPTKIEFSSEKRDSLVGSSEWKYGLKIPVIHGDASRKFTMRTSTKEQCREWVNHIREQAYKLADLAETSEFPASAPLQKSQEICKDKFQWYVDWNTFVANLPTEEAAPKSPKRRDISNIKQLRAIKAVKKPVESTNSYVQNLKGIVREDSEILRTCIHEISTENDLTVIKSEILLQLNTARFEIPRRQQIELLLQKCLMPYQIIDALSNSISARVDFAFTRPFLGLLSEIEEEARWVIQGHPLEKPLEELKSYYLRVVECIQQYGLLALVRPITISGIPEVVGQRILHKWAAAHILSGRRDNQYGIHQVISYNKVHWKKDPEYPGYEYACDCLHRLISGTKISGQVQLLKICAKSDEYLFQASLTVNGVILDSLLREKPQLIAHLNPENYTHLFLLSILTNLSDGKPDNFIATFNPEIRKIDIVGIDNDQAFADPLVYFPKQGHGINTRNILYFFPQARERLAPQAKKFFLQHSPELLIMTWLEHLFMRNQEYEKLKDQNLFNHNDFIKMNLPIKLRPGEITNLYNRLVTIYSRIKADTDNILTHNDILETVQPVVYKVIQHLLDSTKVDKPDQGFAAFMRLWGIPVIENDMPHLLEEKILVDGEEILIKDYINSQTWPKIWDHTNRTLSVTGAFEEFLSILDFSQLKLEVSRGRAKRFLLKHMLPIIPFIDFHLCGADTFTDEDFGVLMTTSKYLLRVNFVRCTAISVKGLANQARLHRSIGKNGVEIILTNCPDAGTFNDVLKARDSGVNITMETREETKFGPTYASFTDIVAPRELDKALGLIEEGKLDKAIECLVEAEGLNNGVLEEHKGLLQRFLSSTHLHTAIKQDLVTVVEFFVHTLGFDINQWDLHGYTPLHLAAKTGNVKMCQVLLGLGANLEVEGTHGLTAVQLALHNGHEAVVDFLVAKGANIKKPCILTGLNVLWLALSKNMLSTARKLINTGFGVETVSTNNENILHFLAQYVRDQTFFEEFKPKLQKLDKTLRSKSTQNSCLMVAALYQNLHFTTFLLSICPDDERIFICRQSNAEGRNALHLLFQFEARDRSEFLAHFELLIKTEPTLLKKQDKNGMNPLLFACRQGNMLAIEQCVRVGATPGVDNENRTCLHLAVELEGTKALQETKLLTSYGLGSEINSKNQEGKTALAVAILLMFKDTKTRFEVASELIQHGASIEKCVEKDNILWEACQAGAVQPVTFLLQSNKASEFIHRIDEATGQTVFHLVVQNGNVEILRLLLGFLKTQTSILSVRRKTGENAAHLAVMSPKGAQCLQLLSESMDIFEPLESGETILDLAIKFNVTSVTETIKSKKRGTLSPR